MSDTTLHLLPNDPQALPSEPAETRALAALRTRFAEVSSQRFDEPAFFDAGQNLDSVGCPSCGEPLDEGWWGQAMDAAHAKRFTDLSVRTPCCGAETTLNDLRYDMPQGFARFALSVGHPDRELAAAELQELEDLLETSLRIVWTRV